MKDIVGQISLTDLMDFFASQPKPEEPQIMLHEGQKVYKVVRGDVEEHIVTGESWICGENERGYRLKRVAGCWDVTWNSSVGVYVFTDLQKANAKAEQYIAENDCILADNIIAKEVVAFRYLYDGRENISFYAILEDDTVYFHYGSTYEHIGKKDEISKFESERNKSVKREGYEEIADYHAVFHNMYKCTDNEWIYAAARYQYFGG